MSKHATRGLDADGNQIYADDGEKATEFDLEKEAEDFACLYYYNASGERVSAGSNPIKADCYKQGFQKALELVMEEIRKRYAYGYLQASVQCTYGELFEDVEQIINKLKGER